MTTNEDVCGQQLIYISSHQRSTIRAECALTPGHEGPHNDGWGHTWTPTTHLIHTPDE